MCVECKETIVIVEGKGFNFFKWNYLFWFLNFIQSCALQLRAP